MVDRVTEGQYKKINNSISTFPIFLIVKPNKSHLYETIKPKSWNMNEYG